VLPNKKARQIIFLPCVFPLPCALYKTHSKEALCCLPERKRTAKIFTHGKAWFSCSENKIFLHKESYTNLQDRWCIDYIQPF
jgi:hypothetical protein